MSYYKILGLEEEPFSTSPDPAFFYESMEHREALLRLEIAIKLKRGASVILGDVGTGKTTLARKLFGIFSDKSRYDFGMVLDPSSESEQEFLSSLMDVFDLKPENQSLYGCKKALERYLFHKGVDENRTVILLIDEAQKLSADAIEVLRTLLNYETNKFKLLQLVLLAQMELLPEIRQIKNFWERIALKYVINPLSETETREMIRFRLKQAGYVSAAPLFNDLALDAVFDFSQGCPRKITMLCHNALEMLVIKNRAVVDKEIIQDLVSEEMGVVHHGS
jgi:general secretion pathway protein A